MSKIVVEGAARSFGDGRVMAFQDLGLTVGAGEFLCIVGPSGCGKTTLLRCVDGLIPLSAGRILIDGQPVRAPRPSTAMVFQHFGLFPWKSLRDNIAYGLRLRRTPAAAVEAALARYVRLVGLEGFERAYPYQLSGGMQQRAGLARALAVNPDVLLMDEPFGSLDAQTREVLQEELLRIQEQERKTVVFVTHSIDEAIALGDRIAVMSSRPGRVREELVVPIPRPRTLESARAHPDFDPLRERIWRQLRGEAAAA
ncbi:MAG TPA: ABC transporter ATP-binding protein [Chloroflexota bacterium]|nr:ABC transporter ATP-binding protein [Chloroflexota bacterium]